MIKPVDVNKCIHRVMREFILREMEMVLLCQNINTGLLSGLTHQLSVILLLQSGGTQLVLCQPLRIASFLLQKSHGCIISFKNIVFSSLCASKNKSCLRSLSSLDNTNIYTSSISILRLRILKRIFVNFKKNYQVYLLRKRFYDL